MIAACKEKVKGALQAAGLGRVELEAEALARYQAVPRAVILAEEGEEITADGSLVAQEYDTAAKVRRWRRRLFRRALRLRVSILARTEAEAERYAAGFLAQLGTSFLDSDGNAVAVAPLGMAPIDDTSILRDQAGVEVRLLCQGGIYRDGEDTTVGLAGGLVVEEEIA